MAERFSGAENDCIRKYRIIRAAIFNVVPVIVDHLTKELKKDLTKNVRVDLFLKLLERKMSEVRQLDEKIQGKIPIKELYEDVRTSQCFYFENLTKILYAAILTKDQEKILGKLELFFPAFQLSSFECPKEATPETAPHQPVLQLTHPPVKTLAIKDNLLECPNLPILRYNSGM